MECNYKSNNAYLTEFYSVTTSTLALETKFTTFNK